MTARPLVIHKGNSGARESTLAVYANGDCTAATTTTSTGTVTRPFACEKVACETERLQNVETRFARTLVYGIALFTGTLSSSGNTWRALGLYPASCRVVLLA